MSLFENSSSEGDVGLPKLQPDHNMNSPAEGKAGLQFPFSSSYSPFPFLPRFPLPPGGETGLSPGHTPLSLNLTTKLEGA